MQIVIVPRKNGSTAPAYKDPSINGVYIKSYAKGIMINTINRQNADNRLWLQTSEGVWIEAADTSSSASNGYPVQPTVSKAPKSAAQIAKEEAQMRIEYYNARVKEGFYLEENLGKNYAATVAYLQNLASKKAETRNQRVSLTKFKYVHGAPFQFIDNTDPRREGDQYGRMFADRIIANAPIAVFTPGAPRFNSVWTLGSTNQDKLLLSLKKSDSDDSVWEKQAKEMLQNMGLYQDGAQYYYFHPMFKEYVKYVNSMCRASAHFAGIGDREIYIREGKSVKAKDFNFRYAAQDPENAGVMRNMLGMNESVAFYFEPGSGVSESFGNTTSESALAGLNKGISDKAREAEQLLGGGAGIALDAMDESQIEQTILNMNDIKNYDSKSVYSRLKQNAKISFLGANMRLPELWRDSNYVKSYSIDVKFVAPYGTPFAKWYHVLCPFFAAVGLVAPLSNTGNSYQSPFILKAYSKGYFNCEMAVIDSMTIKKFGDGDGVTEDGMPSEIEVSISFKDLYSAMALSAFDISPSQFLNNTGLIEFIGTTSGLNMNRAGTEVYASFLGDSILNALKEMPGNFMYNVRDNVVRGMYDVPVVGDLMNIMRLNK